MSFQRGSAREKTSSTCSPVPTSDSALFCVFEGRLVDMLTWLPGSSLGQTGTPLDVADRTGLFHRLGQSMADLHLVSDNWAPPSGFTRRAWDWDGLVGETPVWGRFWENPTLNAADRDLLMAFRTAADAALGGADEGD